MTAIRSAWADMPGYRIDAVPLDGVGRVRAGGRLLAESERCLLVRESDHRDQLYLPADDVLVELEPTDHHTICPFKGEASYWTVPGDEPLENVVWGYPDPMPEVAAIAGYVAFYTDRVDVTVHVPFGDGDEATATFPVWGTAGDLAACMDVAPVDSAEGRFEAPGYPDPPLGTFFDQAPRLRARNVVEGGQLLGGAIAAASRSRPDLRVTNASIVFVKAAHWDSPVVYDTEVRRSGRSIAAHDVRVVQDGALRASALVLSDVGSDDLIRHAEPMPDVPGPGDCPRHDFGVIGREYRVVDGAYEHQDVVGPPELHVWMRLAAHVGPRHMHQAWLAQAVTHWTIAAGMRPHAGLTEEDAHATISTGPTAATIAFHDELDVTGWVLTETRSIYAGRGAVQSQGRSWAADGRLVASSTVQAIVRELVRPIDAMGRDPATVM
jgi:acyl-CoA thioesterase-2